MQSYASFRDAAAEGIRQANCDPVRAEDFPAAHATPRSACLDGVGSADAVVLVLGTRYGFVSPSGLSATEEEYEHAKDAHKRIFVFVEEIGERESKQNAFVNKVQDYVAGHWRKSFCNPEDLANLVQVAVTAADLESTSGQDGRARGRIEDALAHRPAESEGIVWLQAVWTTPRDEEVVDPLALGDSSFLRQVQRLAHDCEPPLFEYEQPKRALVRTSRLQIAQGGTDNWRDAQSRVVVEIQIDGTVSVAQNVTRTDTREAANGGFFDMYFLDPDVVRTRLERAWSFVTSWWHDFDSYLRHDPLIYTVAMHDVGTRRFAPTPRQTEGGVTIPPLCPENPLLVFESARTVSCAACAQSGAEIERTIKLLERRFQEWENRW